MAFLLLHVINQLLKLRNNLFNRIPHRQWIDVWLIVVHPRVHHSPVVYRYGNFAILIQSESFS